MFTVQPLYSKSLKSVPIYSWSRVERMPASRLAVSSVSVAVSMLVESKRSWALLQNGSRSTSARLFFLFEVNESTGQQVNRSTGQQVNKWVSDWSDWSDQSDRSDWVYFGSEGSISGLPYLLSQKSYGTIIAHNTAVTQNLYHLRRHYRLYHRRNHKFLPLTEPLSPITPP